jgi:hypothetical protein
VVNVLSLTPRFNEGDVIRHEVALTVSTVLQMRPNFPHRQFAIAFHVLHVIQFSTLEFRICFGFRISDFEFVRNPSSLVDRMHHKIYAGCDDRSHQEDQPTPG